MASAQRTAARWPSAAVPKGNVVYDAQLPRGENSYRVYRLPCGASAGQLAAVCPPRATGRAASRPRPPPHEVRALSASGRVLGTSRPRSSG